eukprot:12686-Rhodomonas_salina.1
MLTRFPFFVAGVCLVAFFAKPEVTAFVTPASVSSFHRTKALRPSLLQEAGRLRPALKMSSAPGGGDLMGGADEARNQQIATLKNLFYTEKGPETNGAEIRLDDSITGIYEDMPLCRWRYTFLPAFQT